MIISVWVMKIFLQAMMHYGRIVAQLVAGGCRKWEGGGWPIPVMADLKRTTFPTQLEHAMKILAVRNLEWCLIFWQSKIQNIVISSFFSECSSDHSVSEISESLDQCYELLQNNQTYNTTLHWQNASIIPWNGAVNRTNYICKEGCKWNAKSSSCERQEQELPGKYLLKWLYAELPRSFVMVISKIVL